MTKMSKVDYKKNLLLFLIVIGLLLAATVSVAEEGYTKLLPNHLGFQMGYIFWMSAIAGIIGAVFIGYVFGPLFLFAHRYTIGIRMEFGVQKRPEPEKLKIYFKALFPALMALNFALMFAFSSTVTDIVLNMEWVHKSPTNKQQIPLIVMATLLPLMFGIAMGLFSPVWFLLDAGIVFTNKQKVRKIRDPIEVRSVGGWYHYILKGYAGIAVIFSFILFASDMIQYYKTFNPGILLIAFLPILLVIMAIPAFIILDITVEHRQKFMLKFAERLGITKPLEDPLDIGA